MHEHDDDDEMLDLEESYKPFKLTRNEALYLDDTCTLMVDPHPMDDHDRGRHGGQPIGMRPPVFSAGIMVPYDLLEKIGYAVLYTTDEANDGEDVEIQVSISDLLLFREVAQSFVKIGEEQVGFNLKRKVAEALHKEFYDNRKSDQIANRLLQQVEIE
tara:strand:- start:17 stop:490 length:474 start_codon:yes stop_codon:yes gene_type:complete